MTRLSRIQRNCWVLSVPLLLGGVVYTTAVYGASLLVAQDQEPGGSGKHRVILPTEVQPGGGAGGSKPSFGGSGGGTGGMGGMGRPLVLIEWKKPQGEKPDWLIRGENAIRAREKIRRLLDHNGEGEFEQKEQFEFNNQPLSSVMSYISDRYGLSIQINERQLEQVNMNTEEPITLHATCTLRGALTRMFEPRDLDYIIHEDRIEITDRDSAIRGGAVLSYDLAHIATSNMEGDAIVSTIKKMVQPDAWLEGGGASCHLIGSVLLVKAAEGIHEEVRNLLAQLNAMRTDDAEKNSP